MRVPCGACAGRSQCVEVRRPAGSRSSQPADRSALICQSRMFPQMSAIGTKLSKLIGQSMLAVYLATFHDYRRYLAPGERGHGHHHRHQHPAGARHLSLHPRPCSLTGVPMLQTHDRARDQKGTFDLEQRRHHRDPHRLVRSTRGYTIVAALMDEMAFWPNRRQPPSPTNEIINAIRPGMATIPGAMLLRASSYALRPSRRAVGRAPPPPREGRRPHHGLAGRPPAS